MAVHQLLNALDKAMHLSRARRGASRLVADGAPPPPQLDLTAPRQFGVGVPVQFGTVCLDTSVVCGISLEGGVVNRSQHGDRCESVSRQGQTVSIPFPSQYLRPFTAVPKVAHPDGCP